MDSNKSPEVADESEEQRRQLALSIDTTKGEDEGNTGGQAESAANASFSSSTHSNQSATRESHASTGSGSSQNVCAHCGRESVEIRPPRMMDAASSLASSSSLLLVGLPSQEAAKVRKQQEAAVQFLMRPTEEEASEWIFCDVCRKWFHTICVEVQQYEICLIDKFHCPNCRFEHGDSKMKPKRLSHRYAFDEESERHLPVQVGTEQWTRTFKEEYHKIAEAPSPEVFRLYANGAELKGDFAFGRCWEKPIKVVEKRGLGLRMPEDPFFDVLDVHRLLGGQVSVDTIDVFAQQSYTMSLDRFYRLWNKRTRERLYNVLSLEFSETKLAEIIRSPSLVRQLSWVQRFWPSSDEKEQRQARQGGGGGDEGEEEGEEDMFTFSGTRPPPSTTTVQQPQQSARPYVEHFCLMGMRGSYTDFHIDFGGSSVWYHVFRGEKVFFIAQPNAPNLEAFLRWQKDPQRSEKFFGQMLPPGEKLYRLHVYQGETLFLPSGWIHSVYTPEDSLVFGGNFLHSLNVPMQLKAFEMERAAETEERFKFPYFELCNFYAAKNIAESLEDFSTAGQLADQVLVNAASALVQTCQEWMRPPDAKKFAIFGGVLKYLKRAFDRQSCLQRRIRDKTSSRSTAGTRPVRASASSPASSPIPDEPTLPGREGGGHLPTLGGHLDSQDLDSSWEEGEGEELDGHGEEEGGEEGVGQPRSSVDGKKRARLGGEFVLTGNGRICKEGGGGGHSRHSPSSGAVVEIESDGPVRLKIRLPCWRRPSPQPAEASRTGDEEEEEEADLDVGAMFTGRSTHGRKLRPTARISDMADTPGGVLQAQAGTGRDQDFLATVRREGNKNFMAQFTPEERRQIELTERAAETEERRQPFTPSLPPQKKSCTPGGSGRRRRRQKPGGGAQGAGREQQQQKAEGCPPSSSSSSSALGPASKKAKGPVAMSSRERLAKKLGLKGPRKH